MAEIFYASFGAGYRKTEYDYDQMGMSYKTTRHPILPEHIDGRGWVEVHASSLGRARYLAQFYFKNQYAGVYTTTDYWDRWLERDIYYSGGPNAYKRKHGTLCLGVLDEGGLHWT